MQKDLQRNEIREMKIRKNRIRRQRELIRRGVLAVCALIIIIASSMGYTSFLSRASEAGYGEQAKVYVSVMIPYGATLEGISNDHINEDHYDSLDSYMEEVRFINHMDSDDIIAGHYMILPVYTDIHE